MTQLIPATVGYDRGFADYDVVIVGAGFFGATIAHQCATVLGKRVIVVDRRRHAGGNSHSETHAETGIEIHPYGSHIFHTSNELVWNYVKTFSDFTAYKHRVLTRYRDAVFPIPINLRTISQFFNRELSSDDARELIRRQAVPTDREPESFEEKALSLVGRPLYDAFIKGYSQKQWQTPPTELPASIITRIPVRYDNSAHYFSDSYQGLPVHGYSNMFRRMLSHDLIDLRLNIDYFDIKDLIPERTLTVFTGPIDRFFEFKAGRLGWRTVDLAFETRAVADFQGVAVMNFADADVPYTRIHEFRHLHRERDYQREKTVIAREYSRSTGTTDEPYYPVGTLEDQRRYLAYRDMAKTTSNTIFGGRLGTYRYLDMHQAIAAALKAFATDVTPRLHTH